MTPTYFCDHTVCEFSSSSSYSHFVVCVKAREASAANRFCWVSKIAKSLTTATDQRLMSMLAWRYQQQIEYHIHICYRNIESMQFQRHEKISFVRYIVTCTKKKHWTKKIEYVLESNTFRKIQQQFWRKWVNESNFL